MLFSGLAMAAVPFIPTFLDIIDESVIERSLEYAQNAAQLRLNVAIELLGIGQPEFGLRQPQKLMQPLTRVVATRHIAHSAMRLCRRGRLDSPFPRRGPAGQFAPAGSETLLDAVRFPPGGEDDCNGWLLAASPWKAGL
jgi:hypothetical protein